MGGIEKGQPDKVDPFRVAVYLKGEKTIFQNEILERTEKINAGNTFLKTKFYVL